MSRRQPERAHVSGQNHRDQCVLQDQRRRRGAQRLKKVSETVKGIQGAWINETKVVTDGEGNITEWRVNLRVTFVVG